MTAPVANQGPRGGCAGLPAHGVLAAGVGPTREDRLLGSCPQGCDLSPGASPVWSNSCLLRSGSGCSWPIRTPAWGEPSRLWAGSGRHVGAFSWLGWCDPGGPDPTRAESTAATFYSLGRGAGWGVNEQEALRLLYRGAKTKFLGTFRKGRLDLPIVYILKVDIFEDPLQGPRYPAFESLGGGIWLNR